MSTAVAPSTIATLSLPENSMAVLRRRYLAARPGTASRSRTSRRCSVASPITSRWSKPITAQTWAATEEAFYRLPTDLRFFPTAPPSPGRARRSGTVGRLLRAAHRRRHGRDPAGIFQTPATRLIQQTGGGKRLSASRGCGPRRRLRQILGRQATGPVGFCASTIKPSARLPRGGTRRGQHGRAARRSPGYSRVHFPARASEYAITNFNISVGVTDRFIHAEGRRRL